MKRATFCLLALASGAFAAAQMPPHDAAKLITAEGAYATDARLASPEFQGRLAGTGGYAKAARWVASQAKKAGLSAPAEFRDFLQPFPVTLSRVTGAAMELLPEDGKGEAQKLTLLKEFMPILTSSSGEVTAEVIFAGFGITAPNLGRDDYEGLDVKGKIVMVIRGEPKDDRDWSPYDDSRARYANAHAHGAAACLMAGQAVASPNGDRVEGTMTGEVSADFANALLAKRGLKLDELRKVLEAGGTASFPTGRTVRFAVQAAPAEEQTAANVLAVLPGDDPSLRKEFVLVGAHLDHCGDWPALLPGADDNASGSATLLEVAKAAAKLSPRPKRTLVFVWFAGEESGLLGSKYLAGHLPASLGRCAAMINLDMVGAGEGAYVAGGKNFPEVMAALTRARDAAEPSFKLKDGLSKGEARADHGPFQQAGIPAVSLFGMGGNHHGYHTPEDTTYFITPRTMEAAGRVTLLAAAGLAGADGGK
jgi:hypothetical protein